MASLALLIQGPLLSIGSEGAHLSDRQRHVTVNTIRHLTHQCELARAAGFSFISLSTWRSDPLLDQLPVSLPVDQLTLLDDPIPCKAYDYQPVKDNRIRQFYGCHEGVKALHSAVRPDFLARIRTDQTLDFNLLAKTLQRSMPGQLRVLAIGRKRCTHVFDFIIGGTTDDVERHYTALAAFDYFPLHDHIHFDIFFKDAWAECQSLAPATAFVPRTPYFLDVQIPVFRHMFDIRLVPMPLALTQSICWRGSTLEESYLRDAMVGLEEWEAGYKSAFLSSIPRGVRLTNLNLPRLVNVPRMIQLGLIESVPPGPLHRHVAKAASFIRTRMSDTRCW